MGALDGAPTGREMSGLRIAGSEGLAVKSDEMICGPAGCAGLAGMGRREGPAWGSSSESESGLGAGAGLARDWAWGCDWGLATAGACRGAGAFGRATGEGAVRGGGFATCTGMLSFAGCDFGFGAGAVSYCFTTRRTACFALTLEISLTKPNRNSPIRPPAALFRRELAGNAGRRGRGKVELDAVVHRGG